MKLTKIVHYCWKPRHNYLKGNGWAFGNDMFCSLDILHFYLPSGDWLLQGGYGNLKIIIIYQRDDKCLVLLQNSLHAHTIPTHMMNINILDSINHRNGVDATLGRHDHVESMPNRCRSNNWIQGAVSIRKMVLPGMAIPMLKKRRPNDRLIFNMEIAIRR